MSRLFTPAVLTRIRPLNRLSSHLFCQTLATTAAKPLITSLVLGLTLSLSLNGCVETTQVSSQTVTNSDPSRWKQDPKEIARVRTAIAAEYIRDHRLDDAQRQLEQAFKAEPRYAPAYDMMGVLLQQEGSDINLKKAESYFQKAISLDPEFMQAHNNYGVYLSQMKRYPAALGQFQIAASALGYEGRASALENLGRTALKVNNVPLATQSFVKALDTNRQSIIARSELIDILLTQGQWPQAKSLHTDLLAIIGENNLDPRTLLQGARIAHATNNDSDQQRFAKQLLERFPLSNEARQLKGWLANPNGVWK